MLTVREFKELHRIVDDIYHAAKDISDAELARKAGLSYPTVNKLGRYETMYPRIQTVMQLAAAVGFKITVVKQSASVRQHGKSSRKDTRSKRTNR